MTKKPLYTYGDELRRHEHELEQRDKLRREADPFGGIEIKLEGYACPAQLREACLVLDTKEEIADEQAQRGVRALFAGIYGLPVQRVHIVTLDDQKKHTVGSTQEFDALVERWTG